MKVGSRSSGMVGGGGGGERFCVKWRLFELVVENEGL